jgi:CRISPR-associated protein Cas1
MQGWLKFWFEETKRLEVAKSFQRARIGYLQAVWDKDRELKAENFFLDDMNMSRGISAYTNKIESARKAGDLLQVEALFTKQLYQYAAKTTNLNDFTREREATDLANIYLNHGNYLAYGLAACALWVLGIPHGFAVMHGKTRRGALVFDVADLIKDAIVLPWAFICAKEKLNNQAFRQQCLQKFTEHNTLNFMFDQIKQQALRDDFQ